MTYIPDRGDIVFTNFDPSAGFELNGHHPAIILSKKSFNSVFSLALVVPITSTKRGHGFEVPIKGKNISGVIICQNVRTIDFNQRQTKFIEKVDKEALKKTLSIVGVLLK